MLNTIMGSLLTKAKKCLYINNKETNVTHIDTVGVKPKNEEILKEIKNISKTVPDGDMQYNTIKSFFDGEISYAEMRSRCG